MAENKASSVPWSAGAAIFVRLVESLLHSLKRRLEEVIVNHILKTKPQGRGLYNVLSVSGGLDPKVDSLDGRSTVQRGTGFNPH